MCYCYITVLFNDKDQLLCDVAIYVLVQSEEEYAIIWKSKPIAIQNGKDK